MLLALWIQVLLYLNSSQPLPYNPSKTRGSVISEVVTILTVTFFLWFMDIQTTGGPKKKEKKIEIRPKAKPNRVKHLKNQKDNK